MTKMVFTKIYPKRVIPKVSNKLDYLCIRSSKIDTCEPRSCILRFLDIVYVLS